MVRDRVINFVLLYDFRTFKIRLKRDLTVYSPDLVVENDTNTHYYDTSRAYRGFIEGVHIL